MVRNKYLNIIYAAIDSSDRFEQTDFSISETEDKYSTTDLVLTYLPHPTYSLELNIPKKQSDTGYIFKGTICPGLVSFKEEFQFTGADNIPAKISSWMKYIWEELTIDPVVREVEKQRSEINKIFEKINSKDDKNFDNKEITDLKTRLTDLENKFVEELKTTVEDKDRLAEELKDLKKDFETLKTTLGSLKKSGWAKGFYSKVVKWTMKKENRTLLKEGYTIVKELLPDNMGKNLPELPGGS
jgi:hypothetical protein